MTHLPWWQRTGGSRGVGVVGIARGSSEPTWVRIHGKTSGGGGAALRRVERTVEGSRGRKAGGAVVRLLRETPLRWRRGKTVTTRLIIVVAAACALGTKTADTAKSFESGSHQVRGAEVIE